MTRSTRVLLASLHDLAACGVAWIIAYALRFNLDVPDFYMIVAFQSVAVVVPIHAVLFWSLGLYRGIWRYASLPDLRRILLAVGVGAVVGPTVLFLLRIPIPRSVAIMSPILLMMIMGGSRIAYRSWKEHRLGALGDGGGEPVAVIGAEEAAINLIKDLARSTQWNVVAVFSEDRETVGRELHGVKVRGQLEDVPRWRAELGYSQAIIAMPEATHVARRRAVEICSQAGIKVLTVPSAEDLVSGRVTVSQVRHVELDDLLGRDPVQLDAAGLQGWLSGKVALVTGAGGSIGSELCRQVARFGPRRLVLFEQNEFALYTIEQEFAERYPDLPVTAVVGDAKDAARVGEVVSAHAPSVVFHAAAYKHVPLMETANAWQAVLNNVAGTGVIARAAVAAGVE